MELMIIDAIDSILTELDCEPRELCSISEPFRVTVGCEDADK